MKKRTCQKCGRILHRSACVRKDEGLLHAGPCGGEVTEEILPDFAARALRKKICPPRN